MKIVFMGTPDFALACLKALDESPHDIVAVVTQPDRPASRGMKLMQPPVKDYALQKDIPVLQPEKIKTTDSMIQLAALGADIFVVAAYGQILSQKLLDMPKFGAINVHASLLPKYRGASPIQQAIADGETVTGITIMQMDKGMDTGDLILKHTVPIDNNDTGGILHDKLCKTAPAALLEALRLIEDGKAVREPQSNALATHATLITKQMAHLDWHKSPVDIVNLIRAYNPFPGAFARLGDVQIKIWQAKVAEDSGGAPGEIIRVCQKEGIFVAAVGGAVNITELTPSGGKKMRAEVFIRGRTITVGTFLT
ncbi:MAG: methionyl-tRNA formyltransferase [Defluviitaleaceae bacterium]|nr:methionyl-tRNA formyltransferase [Defluviitaleaceae bacterium]